MEQEAVSDLSKLNIGAVCCDRSPPPAPICARFAVCAAAFQVREARAYIGTPHQTRGPRADSDRLWALLSDQVDKLD